MPGGILLSLDLDGFAIVGLGIVETIDGVGSGIFTLGVAIGMENISYKEECDEPLDKPC